MPTFELNLSDDVYAEFQQLAEQEFVSEEQAAEDLIASGIEATTSPATRCSTVPKTTCSTRQRIPGASKTTACSRSRRRRHPTTNSIGYSVRFS